jgi:DNA mismatch repair protein MutS2
MVNTTYRTYLQDAVITMRNNRYCLPVKAEYKNTVKGMIHDQSKAGSTFFIEPAQIVEYNNKLSTLDAEEKEEIEKILATLSAEAAGSVGELESNCRVLSELDFIFARSNLALSMKGAKPEYTTGHFLDIKKARHPFIDPAKVVPIDIRLGEEYTLLIVYVEQL